MDLKTLAKTPMPSPDDVDPALAPILELPSGHDERVRRLEREAREALKDFLPAEAAFCRYMACGFRPGEAAVRAGFKPSTGYSMRKIPRFRRAISIANEYADLKAGVDPTWVRKKLRNVVERCEAKGETKYIVAALKLLSELGGLIAAKTPPPVNVDTGGGGITIHFGPSGPRPELPSAVRELYSEPGPPRPAYAAIVDVPAAPPAPLDLGDLLD